ncbi:TPA: phospholipase [Burkholderia aenigmatica]|uniref:alpha/beta hydrolase n=1 Tax=Burkholderia sp. AU45251 TaxID=3059204 RepID=UPI00264E6792|nr:phospholipase [Burkholderia sp. AU45251]HDR9481858.1 phospholipase [Burkholderia aenigmatica]MDN7513516.1 phospholipase [Burkholderia sp. AU45251]HDR9513385.1 phospholipase [Burkholderia aenigmatica]HDR9590229.1 phospholipase [Burkholderia aenigmatica]HDR9601836.1 phospholipase [Burkholderia aenigmatica]
MTDVLPLITDPESSLQYRLRPGTGRPVARLLLLHGVGGNETNLLNLTDVIDPRIEIAFLRAPLTFGPNQHAWFPVRFGPNGPEIDAARADASRVKLITLLRAFRARDGAGAELPTVIAGFSQGGIMSASVGLTSPGDVAAFAVLCGRILPEIDPLVAPRDALRPLHALIMHGRFDDKLPVAWADTADAKLAALGVAHDTRLYNAGHELTDEMAGDFGRWVGERTGLN